jgi:hypothetical protein
VGSEFKGPLFLISKRSTRKDARAAVLDFFKILPVRLAKMETLLESY